MKDRQLVVVAVLLTLSIVVAVTSAVWPGHPVFWRSPERIQQYLLDQTPIGSSEKDVIRILHGMGVRQTSSGFIVDPAANRLLSEQMRTQTVDIIVARYRNPFYVDVEASYVFDSQGRLLEIRVRKTVDTL